MTESAPRYTFVDVHSYRNEDPKLHQALVESAVECFRLAFNDDPFLKWIHGGALPSPKLVDEYYRTWILYTQSIPRSVCAMVNQPPDVPLDASSVEVVAAIISFPPGYHAEVPPSIGAAFGFLGFIVQSLFRDPVVVKRALIETGRLTDKALSKNLGKSKDKLYFVHSIGTKTGHQGAGLGNKVLADLLDRADKDGLPCFLTSSSAKNLSFYRRLGFEEREVIMHFDKEKTKPYTVMVRPATKP
ncbi:hypothetical protein M427DRAFT_38397 [Gonapodya prolifera JEL478]|uniref:N-acetyltransferase domain-containing protein n=1 Tax=Gonapodya prolifera (strain JEL478) TaxID=1344416 RepID=A0A138ZZ22_GONPJ|nr:hypothetical protein M427DRAFT_38397 [Gonapodya prolifera JEL478]|eukprot:KXS09756.1 hypothetical protein M427DRAFT_38397 [Gonapodya prolifera JEL478]